MGTYKIAQENAYSGESEHGGAMAMANMLGHDFNTALSLSEIFQLQVSDALERSSTPTLLLCSPIHVAAADCHVQRVTGSNDPATLKWSLIP